MSRGIGAYSRSTSISTMVRPGGPISIDLTLPIVTPARRTSASRASVVASGKAAWKR